MRPLITNWVKWRYSDLIKGKDRMVSGLVGLIVTKTYLRKMCHLNCLMWWMDVWIICNLGVRLEWYGVFYWTDWWYTITNMVRTIIQRYSSTSNVKSYQATWPTSTYFLRLVKQFQLLLRSECWMLELRRWGRQDTKGAALRLDITNYCHKTSVTQQYPELTITQSVEKGHEYNDWQWLWHHSQ